MQWVIDVNATIVSLRERGRYGVCVFISSGHISISVVDMVRT
jgi:hypothetical protein